MNGLNKVCGDFNKDDSHKMRSDREMRREMRRVDNEEFVF